MHPFRMVLRAPVDPGPRRDRISRLWLALPALESPGKGTECCPPLES